MQKWKCHKVVEAVRVDAVRPLAGSLQINGVGDQELMLLGEDATVAVPVAWVRRHAPDGNPQLLCGGYYVRYADGYDSWSPAQAFEKGYTELVEIDESLFTAHTNEPILRYFTWTHLPERLQKVSKPFAEMAASVILQQPRSPERTVALRKLLECKDATVRAALEQQA